jgi:hypothetical protein
MTDKQNLGGRDVTNLFRKKLKENGCNIVSNYEQIYFRNLKEIHGKINHFKNE